jgi:S-adenosylmethionine synthetase
MDAESINLIPLGDVIVPQNIYSTTVQQHKNGISNVPFRQYELEIAKEYYNTKLIAVDHDKTVKA